MSFSHNISHTDTCQRSIMMDVQESLECSEGSSSGSTEATERLKMQGNKHFDSKNFKAAIECYSDAIALSGSSHILYGNRSAAHRWNGDWESAAADARESLKLDSSYTKGYYRLAQAYLHLDDVANAEATVKMGLLCDPGNKLILSLAKSIQEASRGKNASADEHAGERNTRSTSRSKRGMRSGDDRARVGLEKLSLYDDKEGPGDTSTKQNDPQSEDTRALRKIFRSLRDSVGAPRSAFGPTGRPHELEGVFRQLTNPEAFRRIVASGLSEEERENVPRTFQELLRSPLYSSAVEECLPHVVTSAASVLEGVKERGRKAGDVMDAATEEALKPQVLQEAFARKVVSVVAAVHAKTRAKVAKEKAELASPDGDEASWNQLDQSTVSELMALGREFAVQDAVLCGDEWESIFLDDCVRFAESGQLSPDPTGARHGEMAWVEPSAALESTFPALHELLTSLHGLAFELNRKAPDLRLSRPLKGSTVLLRLREGCRLPAKLDSRTNGAETGHSVSCVYFVGSIPRDISSSSSNRGNDGAQVSDEACAGGHLKLQNVEIAPVAEGVINVGGKHSIDLDTANVTCEDTSCEGQNLLQKNRSARASAQGLVVEPTGDRLTLYRSDRVSNEMLEVRGTGCEQYVVRFWMHSAQEGGNGRDEPPR